MIPQLTYNINSVYDELMRYGWALMIVQQAGTLEGMTLEYCFSGGGFDISLIQVNSGKYFIRIYNKGKTGHVQFGLGRQIVAISDSVPYRSWMRVLQISTGDMIRLLYGDPLTFALRLKQYEVESVLDEL